MGIDLYLVEVLDKDEATEETIHLIEVPHIRRIFKDKVFMKKPRYEYPTKEKEIFKSRRLKRKNWDCFSMDETTAKYRNTKTDEIISIPLKELGFKEIEVSMIKIKKLIYRSGNRKLTASWNGLYNYTMDRFPRVFERMRYLTKKKDLETFINTFVVEKYKSDLKIFTDLFIDDKTIFMIDW